MLVLPVGAFSFIEAYDISDVGTSTQSWGLDVYGEYIYVVNNYDKEVYKFDLNLTYTGTHWDTEACGNTNPMGLTTNGTYIWIVDDGFPYNVYKYDMSGTYINSWNTYVGNTNPLGITTNSTYIWITDIDDDKVYKYQMDGTIVDSFYVPETISPHGITTNSNYIWVSCTVNDRAYKYQMDGTYVDSFSISETTGTGYGMGNNNISMWILDAGNNRVVRYAMTLDCEAIDPTNVEETTVDLKGVLANINASSCGFWYNTTTPASGTNVTCTGSYSEGDVFTKSVSGLTPGQYYYYRAWAINDTTFYNSTYERTFLTKPEPPTVLTIPYINATNITLTWTNATIPAGTTQKSVLVYSSTGQPTSVTDGTIAYNGTAETYKVEGLTPGLHYYFSLWTYINASGSPFYWWFSDSYETAGATTEGGTYNITFRWECNQTLIDTGTDFQNSILTAETLEGEILYTNSSLTSNPTSVNVSKNPDIFRFDYNSTGMVRSVIPTPGTQNYTIYVCCYPEWDGINETLSNYQIYYTFSFTDFSTGNVFALSNDTQLDIYKYNETGKFYIHQDYWSAENNVKVALHYGERFYLGVKCSSKSILFLKYIDTLTDTLLEIDVIPEELNEYVVTDFVVVNSSRISTGLWVNYTDISFTTNSVNVSIYHIYPNNDTKVLEYQYEFTTDTSDYLWTVANGYNNTYTYKMVLIIDINEVSENYTYVAFSIPFPYEPAVDPNWFDNLFDEYIIDLDGTIGLTFSHLAIFILAFTFLIGLGHKWASLGMIACGMMLCIGFTLIFESPISFGGVVLGVMFIAFGLLFVRSDFVDSGGSF